MRKITTFVRSEKPTEILFDETMITSPESTMMIKNVTVFWRYSNVVENDNDMMTLSDNTQIQFPPGFFVFDEIKKYLDFNDIDIEKTPHNGGCKIKPHSEDIFMGKFAPILGFPEEEKLTAGVWETSPYPMDVYRGLRWIDIKCNVVNEHKNCDRNGKRSDLAITLAVPPDGRLLGTATTYDLESEVTVYNGAFNRMLFSVGNNTTRPVDADVLFDEYVK